VFAGDEKLTTALLDRLAHHATVITTKGKSYRMRKRRDAEAMTSAAPPKPSARAAPRSRRRNPVEAVENSQNEFPTAPTGPHDLV
jgi:hypothetical protein